MNKTNHCLVSVVNLIFYLIVAYLSQSRKSYMDPRLAFITLIILCVLFGGIYREIKNALSKTLNQLKLDSINNLLKKMNLLIFYYSCIIYYLPKSNFFENDFLSKHNCYLNFLIILGMYIKIRINGVLNILNYLFIAFFSLTMWNFTFYEYLVIKSV